MCLGGGFVPGAAGFPTAPVSSDAVLMTTAYVDPAQRGGGVGRMLVQGMARDLIQRGGIAAVEAFGDPTGRGGHCVVPVDFLGGVGFKTHRPHPRTPHPAHRAPHRRIRSLTVPQADICARCAGRKSPDGQQLWAAGPAAATGDH